MTRDRNLIRAILRAVEEEAPFKGAPKIEGYSETQVEYHLMLLIEAGYVHGLYTEAGGSPSTQQIRRLNGKDTNIWTVQ